MKNVFLSTIRNKADVTLQHVKHVIFCGYSFPDADTHIKYLLKRAQTNSTQALRFTVINNFPGKDPNVAADERARFRRFLGRSVNYTDLSFEQFAADPMTVLKP